jgi:hypothetical protein
MTERPCDLRLLSSQVNNKGVAGKETTWDLSSEYAGKTLADLIYRAINVGKAIRGEEYGVLGELLKLGTQGSESEATPEQEAFIKAGLPLINLHVYCSPCVCLIHTALSICRGLRSPYIKIHLRPDDRLVSSCCTAEDRSLGIRSLHEWVMNWELGAELYSDSLLATHLDTIWLDQRLEHIDYEQSYDFTASNTEDYSSVRFLILGEADHLSHMVQQAPGRIPRAGEIWRFIANPPPTRTLFSRFIESRSMGELLH